MIAALRASAGVAALLAGGPDDERAGDAVVLKPRLPGDERGPVGAPNETWSRPMRVPANVPRAPAGTVAPAPP